MFGHLECHNTSHQQKKKSENYSNQQKLAISLFKSLESFEWISAFKQKTFLKTSQMLLKIKRQQQKCNFNTCRCSKWNQKKK